MERSKEDFTEEEKLAKKLTVPLSPYSAQYQEMLRIANIPFTERVVSHLTYDDDVEEEDRQMMREMAACRLNIMYCETAFHMLLFAIGYRFYELRLAFYQWKRKHIIICFHTAEQKHHLQLAERVILQFRQTLNQFTEYYPEIPEHPDPCDEAHGTLRGCRVCAQRTASEAGMTDEEQELTLSAVELIKNLLLVIDIYEKKIEYKAVPMEDRDEKPIPLDVAFSWYQKMTYFLQAFKKSFRVLEKTVIAVYKYEESGRKEKQWRDIAELDTMIFVEVLSPQQKLEKILRCTRFPPVPKNFNHKDITSYMQNKWDEAMLDPDTVVYHSDMEQEPDVQRTKRKRSKKKKKRK